MVPPGLADNESGRATLSSVSVLNYGHVSASMVLRPFQLGLPFPLSFFSRSKRAKSYRVDEPGSFHEAVSVQIADETYQGGFETSQASAATLGYVPSRMKRSIAAFEHAKRDWKNPLNLLNLLPAPLYDHCKSLFLSIFLSLVTDSFHSERRSPRCLSRRPRLDAIDCYPSSTTSSSQFLGFFRNSRLKTTPHQSIIACHKKLVQNRRK